MFRNLLLLLAAASLLLPSTSSARLTRLVITQTVPLAGGVAWGSTGPYERLTGTAYFEGDPNHPRNAVIVDVDNAPRNSHGMVEFSTQFMIRSEEHTSELQSRPHLVCRLLLEKKSNPRSG